MQILSAEQIRSWDEYTIAHEPIVSIDLMERAAAACFQWIMQHYEGKSFSIFCAKGNNGGDGLAIARMLSSNHDVTVYVLEFGHLGTEDFQTNLARLHQTRVEIKFIPSEENIPTLSAGDIVIDALFGSGLNRPIEGLTAALVSTLNESGNEIISIDIPSGLSVDNSSKGNIAIVASHTLSFQCYKPAFLVSENEPNIGTLHILNIGLHPGYLESLRVENVFIDDRIARSILRSRNKFSHKGSFGHALIIAGSFGKIGAAILAAKACLRAGVGLLTVHTPVCGMHSLHTSVPEAMLEIDSHEKVNSSINTQLKKYHAIGIGPGIGTEYSTSTLLQDTISNYPHPMVIDADALNIMSAHPEWLGKLPALSILTPHPKEFERLFGSSKNDFERLALAKQKAKEYNVIIIVKGHHSFVAAPTGSNFFNSTGNPGMATAGSGDALTGIITSLVAQQYSPMDAAVLGVYLHGLAGDIAARKISEPSLVASDIIQNLGNAFRQLLNQV